MRQDVAASKYGMVLDHSLFVEYQLFIQGKNRRSPLLNKILSYYHNDFLSNVGQFDHNKIEINRNYRAWMAKNGFTNQTLEELAKLTTYKIILTEDKTNFPFVNIDEGKFCPALSNFYEGDAERDAAREYLKNLCMGAKRCILLYDRYINGVEKLDELLDYILPNSKIKFISGINEADKTKLATTHDKLTFEGLGSVRQHHDRYLIIDDSIEVVLTSGFEYLKNKGKEISLVIRPIRSMHGLRD